MPEMGTEPLPAEVTPEGKHGKDSNPQWGFKDVSRFLHQHWIRVHLNVVLHSEGSPHYDVQGKQAEQSDNIDTFTLERGKKEKLLIDELTHILVVKLS